MKHTRICIRKLALDDINHIARPCLSLSLSLSLSLTIYFKFCFFIFFISCSFACSTHTLQLRFEILFCSQNQILSCLLLIFLFSLSFFLSPSFFLKRFSLSLSLMNFLKRMSLWESFVACHTEKKQANSFVVFV